MQILRSAGFDRVSSSATAANAMFAAERPKIIRLAKDLLNIELGNTLVPTKDELANQLRYSNTPEVSQSLLAYLLAHPDQLNEAIGDYGSPGHYAAQKKAERLYRILKRFPNFDVNKLDSVGNTHLHYAAQQLDENLVDYILSIPSRDKTIKNKYNDTPKDMAIKYPICNNPDLRQRIIHMLA